MMKDSFQDAVAVVTGGTSGIGEAIVRALVARGCRVFFCGRSSDTHGIEETSGGRAVFTRCDLTEMEDLEAWMARIIRETGGKIDYLVNNVACDGRCTLDEAKPELFDSFFQINLRAAVQTTRLLLNALRAGRGKAVANLGTTNWMLGLSPFTLYASAKAGLLGFTRAFAREFGPEGIRANMVSPGWVMTEKQLELYVTQQDKEALLHDQALPFLLEERHVVPAVLFLLSDAAAAITGQNLIVDGGKLMQ